MLIVAKTITLCYNIVKMRELAYNLKRIRKEKGETQQTLAEKVGVSSTFIANIEQGRRKPSMEIVEKIVDVLKIKPKALFEEIE